MKIAIDARMIRASGIGVFIDHMLARLPNLRPDWQFLLLGTPAELEAVSAPDNVRVLPFIAPIYSIAEHTLPRCVAGQGVDLLWVPHYNIPVLWRHRLLVTIHDVLPLAHPELFPGIKRQAYARLVFGQVRRRASRIAFISNFSANEFGRLIGKPRGETVVINSCVEKEFFRVARPQPYARPYVLFVGNIKPHKNLRRLAQAFVAIKDKIPHDLVLLGRREGFITGDNGLAWLADEPRVVFAGQVSDDVLAAYYQHADMVAMPSYYEGFGLPPLEAMAAGTPVLAARAASIPEVCGDAVLYCDPWSVQDMSEKLLTLLYDADLQRDLRAKGRERIARYGWDSAATRYAQAMSETLDQPSGT